MFIFQTACCICVLPTPKHQTVRHSVWEPEEKRGLLCGVLPASSTSRQAEAVLLKGPVCLLPPHSTSSPPIPLASYISICTDLWMTYHLYPAQMGFPHPRSSTKQTGGSVSVQYMHTCISRVTDDTHIQLRLTSGGGDFQRGARCDWQSPSWSSVWKVQIKFTAASWLIITTIRHIAVSGW